MRSSPKSRLALTAMKLGVPLPLLLSAIRMLFGINCPYCEFYNRLLIKRNKIGEPKLLSLLDQVIKAKRANDTVLLERLKKEFL